jgi:hypothetical protein
MMEYIASHQEVFFVLCVMAGLAVLMLFLSSANKKSATQRKIGSGKPDDTVGQ